MSKNVRVHELAKELNVTSKEVVAKLAEFEIPVKNHMSSIGEDSASKIKVAFKSPSSNVEKPKQPTPATSTSTQKVSTTTQNVQTSTPTQTSPKPSQSQTTEPTQGNNQSSSQGTNQGQRQGYQGNNQGQRQGYQGNNQGQRQGYQGNNQGQRQGYQGNNQGQRQGYQGNNQGQRQGYQGNNQGQGYQGNNQGQRQGYQGNNQGQRQSYQGNNQGQGYQGNNQGQRQGYQGNNQGQRQGYQGNNQGQGYQGNNQGQRQGYQGNNQGQRQGYQGNNQGQGYQGNNQGQRQGYQGNNQGGGQRSFQKDSYNKDAPNNRGGGQSQRSNFSSKNDKNSKLMTQTKASKAPRLEKSQNKSYDYDKELPVKKEEILKAELKRKQAEEKKNEVKIIYLPKTINVGMLSKLTGENSATLIKSLMKEGIIASVNQDITYDQACALCEEFGYLTDEEPEVNLEEVFFAETEDKPEDLVKRPPVVVVMGHVDHGKTSLLDVIRKSNVTDKEAGGITQHIGAYTVSIDGNPITFLDTPVHEAFTAMRMRGAKVTDIAILVVAADDGVMPQTIEAINHAKAAGVEIIVAMNKIDKESANPDRVKQELSEYGLVVEDWGGEIICVPVSAMKRTGIDSLLEMIILVSEMKELKANNKKQPRGAVIEALLDKGKGPVATVLVQSGTLKVGDIIVAGSAYGKVRAMTDDKGKKLKKAGPSIPVEILGLSEAPKAGDAFFVCANDKQARQYSDAVTAKDREELSKASPQKVSLEDLFTQIQAGNMKDLNIVVKADVQGSAEAIKMSLEKLSNEEVRIRTIHCGVGAITESDVMLASTSNAIVIGFNVRPDAAARDLGEKENVDIRLYRVIYSAIEDISTAMKGLLDPVFKEVVIGHAEIRQIFKASNIGNIGGAYITDGKFTRNAQVRIVRDGVVVYEGTLETLKRFKDDVKEVAAGYECGLLFTKFNDIKEGDNVEAFVMEKEEPK